MPDGMDHEAECPYGKNWHNLDVTMPEGIQTFSGEWFCVIWSLVPRGVLLVTLVDSVVTTFQLRGVGTREVAFLSFIIILNAFVAISQVQGEPRPETSCVPSCGYYSGQSIAFFVLMFLDAVYRVAPQVPGTVENAKEYVKKASQSQALAMGWTLEEWLFLDMRIWSTVLPLSAVANLGPLDFVSFVSVWGVVLLPAPLAHYVLNDFSAEQVVYGTCIGVVLAGVYFAILRHGFLPHFNHRLGSRIGYIFVHNFPLPLYEVMSAGFITVVQARELQETAAVAAISCEDSSPGEEAHWEEERQMLVDRLAASKTQVAWYIKQLAPRYCRRAVFREDKVADEMRKRRLAELQAAISEQLHALDPENWPFPAGCSSASSTGDGWERLEINSDMSDDDTS